MILQPPVGYRPDRPVRDLTTAHSILRQRYMIWSNRMRAAGFVVFVNEVYRYHVRQQWLYGAGRTAAECLAMNVPAACARPSEPRVTNAASAETSAHGWTDRGMPASAALDVAPVGKDGKPWTADDPWDTWLACALALEVETGLVHFRKGQSVWDKPHLQLKEWSDVLHRVVL